MKIAKLTAIACAILIMFTTCELTETSVKPEPQNDVLQSVEEAKYSDTKTVMVPFKSKFYTTDGAIPTPCVEDAPIFLITQVGDGTATHLGKFTTHMTFCFDVTDNTYVGNGGVFVAANGDELWFNISGEVKPFDDPDGVYDAYFQDTFVFTGGTGRFEEATGEGVTDSYVINEPFRTDHEWDGYLTLVK